MVQLKSFKLYYSTSTVQPSYEYVHTYDWNKYITDEYRWNVSRNTYDKLGQLHQATSLSSYLEYATHMWLPTYTPSLTNNISRGVVICPIWNDQYKNWIRTLLNAMHDVKMQH